MITRSRIQNIVSGVFASCDPSLHICVFLILCGRSLRCLNWRKEWRLSHPNYLADKYGKAYSRSAVKKHYNANRDKCRERRRAWYKKNRQRCLDYAKLQYAKYYPANKAKIVARNDAYAKTRYANDPIFRMIRSLRNRLHTLVKRADRAPRSDFFGCSHTQFREHIERQLNSGMTWDNYGRGVGKWSVDHIVPIVRFDHSVDEQRRLCWHFTNLQPLWFVENSRKHTKAAA